MSWQVRKDSVDFPDGQLLVEYEGLVDVCTIILHHSGCFLLDILGKKDYLGGKVDYIDYVEAEKVTKEQSKENLKRKEPAVEPKINEPAVVEPKRKEHVVVEPKKKEPAVVSAFELGKRSVESAFEQMSQGTSVLQRLPVNRHISFSQLLFSTQPAVQTQPAVPTFTTSPMKVMNWQQGPPECIQ